MLFAAAATPAAEPGSCIGPRRHLCASFPPPLGPLGHARGCPRSLGGDMTGGVSSQPHELAIDSSDERGTTAAEHKAYTQARTRTHPRPTVPLAGAEHDERRRQNKRARANNHTVILFSLAPSSAAPCNRRPARLLFSSTTCIPTRDMHRETKGEGWTGRCVRGDKGPSSKETPAAAANKPRWCPSCLPRRPRGPRPRRRPPLQQPCAALGALSAAALFRDEHGWGERALPAMYTRRGDPCYPLLSIVRR